jgi:hypothetical protein
VARKIISNLLEVSGCPQEYQGILKKKIAVLLNTDIFHFTSLLNAESVVG